MLRIIRLLPSHSSVAETSSVFRIFTSATFSTRRSNDDDKDLVSKEKSWQLRLPLRQYRLQRDEHVSKQYSHEGGVIKQYYAPEELERSFLEEHHREGMTPEKWEYNNKVVWPPHYRVPETGLPKTREVFHCLESVKYSPKRMWTIGRFVQGVNVNEALLQLSFIHTKGADIMTKVITDAMKRANEEFHIEYPTDMHIAEAFAIQSAIVKGQRRHRGSIFHHIRYRYCTVFVRLEEGDGPGFKGRVAPETGWQKMQNYYNYLRERRIKYSL